MVKILLEKIFKNENNKLVVKLKFEVNNYKTKIEKKNEIIIVNETRKTEINKRIYLLISKPSSLKKIC